MNSKILKTLFTASLSLLFLSSASFLSAEDASNNWNQWRGPNRDGQITSTKWPATLTKDNLKQLWKVSLGPSYSGPLVINDKVFVTETKDQKIEVVSALNKKTGKEIWSSNWEGAMKVPFFAKANGDWIRSTPIYDEGKIYVAGIRDVLVCLDAKTGDEIWKIDFVEKYETPLPAFGFVCSPLIHGELLYVQAAASLVCVNKNSGEVQWRSLKDLGGMFNSAFSSPFIATLAGKEQLLVQTRMDLAGVDLESGDVLWKQKVKAFRGMNILPPTPYKDGIFTSSYGGRAHLYQVSNSSDEFSVTEKWDNKVEAYMSSPVVIGQYVYMHLKNRRLTCIDLETGESKWTTTPFGKYWSMIVQGNKILALDETGELLYINANPEKYDLIGKVKVSDESTWAHLGIHGNEVFVRSLNSQIAFKWQD